ncbi:ABC transporter substrate-binding protein [Pseudobacteroides cellulosolvens]|uniref:Extracellular solute-binding protein family 1 n=1 Tax=Pseudobacteroides cellulosolvens ATCC 35603 = DSM 2933 TaxID=398512 RepID=A0A0L6JNY3_9FIRM|nr:extracellular solute-binding protein [Pseudobacteroides cellulosolvens]KNY27077.1 extracellular solute-binding protein family 1 [Pseudobacteroides cellulosolvens ATCC 35603 = DSM 2933]
MNMKLLRSVAAAAMIALFITGCGINNDMDSTSMNAKSVESKRKIIFSTNRLDKLEQLNQLAEEFMIRNPDIIIEFEGLKDYDRIYKARLAVNELMDISAVTEIFPDMGDNFVELDDIGFSRENFTIPLALVNQHVYSLPVGVNYDGVIYNKAAFKKAGINEVPRTMKDLFKACEKLKSAGIVPLAINAKDKWPSGWYARRYPKMLLDNPGYENELAEKSQFLSGDSPVLSILKTLRDMKIKGYLEPDITQTDWEQMKKDFAQGKVGMTFLGSWFVSQVIENGAEAKDVGMFPFPETKSIILDNDFTYAISKRSMNIDAAKAFLKYAWEESRISKAIGQASPFKNSANNPAEINELLSFDIPAKTMMTDTSRFNVLLNAAGIDMNDMFYEYLISDNPKDVIDDYNERWMNGRQKVNGSKS